MGRLQHSETQRRQHTSGAARLGLIAGVAVFGWLGTAVLTPHHAAACPIAPGTSTCAPDVLTVSPGATVVASQSGTINASASGATLNATYTEKVYRDPTNNYCANCLTWVVQVTNMATSTNSIERVTVSNFHGFNTDIGTDSNGAPGWPTSGTNSPNNVERNSSGSVLSWDFNGASNALAPGQTTVLLEVETNSTNFVPGTLSVQDGIAGSGPAFSPALPEIGFVPAFGIAGGALFGAFAWRRRRNRSRNAA